MKGYLRLSFVTILLAGCMAKEETSPLTSNVENTTNVVGEAKFVIANMGAPMTDEEALLLAEEIEQEIFNISVRLQDVSEEEGPDAEQLTALAAYATEHFIEQYVVVDEHLCGVPCYTVAMPAFLHYAWQPTVKFSSVDAFSVSYLAANVYIEKGSYSLNETLYFKREAGKWKIDSYEETKQDMNLSAEDIAPYLTQLQYEFSEIGPAETLEFLGERESVYSFKMDEESQTKVYVLARTGYIYYEDIGSMESDVYERDPVYDLLFYPWSYEQERLDLSNRVVTSFVERIDAIDQRIYEAQNDKEGLALAIEMVEDYTALHTEVYEAYVANLDETDHERYEIDNRNWYFHFTNSLSDYVSEEATELDVVLMQADALKNRIYSMLINRK